MLTQGPRVAEFEEELARACETRHAVAVSSGTAALHLAVLALGLEPGDEMLVPAYTFPATANVVALSGLRPVLVDVDPVTMNIDPGQARRSGRGRRRSWPSTSSAARAGSRSCPDLPVIEDAAGALGARRRRPRVRLARPRRLPELPPAQDRHDRRGRRGHDRRRRASQPRWRSSATTAGARSPTPTCPRRGSTTASPTSSPRSACRSCAGSTSCSAARERDRGRPTPSGWPGCR